MPDRPAQPTTQPRYDREAREWIGQCPHGDVCTGCDARGYCTREEDAQPTTQPADALLAYLLREPERKQWAAYARALHDSPNTNDPRARAAIQTLAERLLWIEERLARVSGQPAAAEGSATETTEPEGKYGDWRDAPGNYWRVISATETTEQCGARREHPLSTDYYVRCVLDAGHEGEHTTVDGCRWADSSPYGLPATETTEQS